MYTQAMDTMAREGRAASWSRALSADEQALQDRFDARIDAGDFIEAKDWMPEHYRKTLLRQISQHAHSEIVGMLPEGNWITPRADAQAQGDPAGQGAGRRRPRPVPVCRGRDAGHQPRPDDRRAAQRQGQVQLIFNYPTLTWADIGTIGWLVDGAAIMNQVPICRCSYAPYARAMIRICREESFHQRQGFDSAADDDARRHRRAARDGAGRGEPLVVAVPDDVRPARRPEPEQRAGHALGHQARQPTTTLRQKFVDATVQQAKVLGVTLPDPDLKWNAEREHWDFGAIDWDEFWRVVGGDGPCNRERLATRVKAWDDGAWVREAALAHAASKQQAA